MRGRTENPSAAATAWGAAHPPEPEEEAQEMTHPQSSKVERVCTACGNSFSVPPKHAKSAKYCSNACVAVTNRKAMVAFSCEVCGAPFAVQEYVLKHRTPRFCSKRCSNSGQTQDVSERFWGKVDRGGGSDACWIWLGGDDGAGYGTFHMPDRTHRAHRVAFFLTYGRWPDVFACHNCPTGDNRKCVNPAHLFEGDSTANNRDRAAKGRSARGSGHPKATISEGTVIAMRRRFDEGQISYGELALAFGVSYIVAWQVATRRTWKHVV